MILHTRMYVRVVMHEHSITQACTLYQRECDFNMNNINRNICNNLCSYMQLCISIAPPLPPLLLPQHSDSRDHEIGTLVMGHSPIRSLVRSHRSLVRLLRTARFARALCCAHSFTPLLSQTFLSSWDSGLILSDF